jgi:radical SAM protein with 4Fe4S-binding SPASM domain
MYDARVSKPTLYWRLMRRVAANPRYFYFGWRQRAHTDIARRLAKNDTPARDTFFPVKLDLRIVYACNLRCKMCAQWGDTGTYFDYGASKLKQKLDLTVIESVVRELVPHGLRYVDMEGGETFLYPQIIDLFRMLKSLGLFVKPVTNGTLLTQYAKDVVAAGVDAVNISVDGDRDAHNTVRQADWAYDRTMDGLRALVDARAAAGAHRPFIKISFTMTRHNKADGLRKLCADLAGKGLIDAIVIKSSPIWIPEERGHAYDELVEKYFGARGVTSWRGFLEDYRDFADGATEVAETLQELKAADYDFFVDRVPTVPYEQIPRLYTDYDWDLGRSHCPIAYVEPTIDSDGNVYPCNLFTDEAMSMGNVNETPFLDIWFGERFQTFRRMLADQGGLLPICNRCCQLTEA